MFVYLRFSKSHINIVSIRLSLAYSSISFTVYSNKYVAGWRAGRHFHSEITEHCMDHHLLRIPFCESGPSTFLQTWGECIWLLYQNLYIIYTLSLGFQSSNKRHRTCWFRKLPRTCDKNHPVCFGKEGKATAELKFTVVLTSSVQANPAEGWTYTPTKMNMSPRIDQNRDHFKKDMSFSNQENFRGYDMLVIRGVIPFFCYNVPLGKLLC